MSEAVIKLKVDGAGAAQRDVNSVSSALNSLGSAAKTSLVGLAAGLSAASFADYIKSAIDAADNLNDLSKSTAISVENLSGLQLAAKQSGSELESVAQAINKLSVNIGKDSERFAKLGITAKEPIEAFKQLADVYKSIEDPQTRAAVAAEALGKSWQGTAPLLAEGSKSIGDMVEKGKRLSGVTQEMADEADKFNDSLEELKQNSSGLAIKLAGELLPAFNQILPAIKIAYEESGKLEAALVALGSVGAFLFTDEFSSETVKIKNLKDELNSLYADQKARADTFGFDGSLKRLLFGGYSTDELPKAIEYTKYQIQQLEQQLANKSKPKASEDKPKGLAVDTKSFLGGTGVQKEKDDYDKLNKAIQARIATAQEELRLGRALSESEKESANFKRGLAEGTIKLTAAEAKRYEGSINQLDIELRKLETEKLYQAARDKNEGEIKRINDETLALEVQIEAYEKLPSLITQVTIAKLEEQKAGLKNSGLDNVDEEISAINRKIEAYGKLKNVQVNKQYQDASKFIDDYAKSVEESNKQIQLEASLIGKSAIERDVILDQARIQVELEKKINDIKKQGLTLDQETGLIEKANQVANAERSASQLKAQQKEWNDFYSSIYDGLSDSLYRAFESGKGFFQSFWDGIKNLFKTTVLKLAIQGTVGSVLGGASGLASAASGASGLGGLVSGISSLFGGSAAAGAASGAGALGGIGALGSSIAGAGSFLFGTGASTLSSYAGTVALAAGLGGTVATAISAAVPVIGAAAAAYFIGKAAFGHSAREITGTTINGTLGTDNISRDDAYLRKGGFFAKDKRGVFSYNLATSAAVADGKTYVDTARQKENAELLKSLNDAYADIKKSTADYAKAIGYSADLVNARTDQISYAIGKTAEETQKNVETALTGVSNTIADSVLVGFEELKKSGETSSQSLVRLAGDLTGVNTTFKSLGLSVYTLDVQGAKAAESLIAAFGDLDTLVNASKTYYDNFYSDQEKLSLKTQALGQAFKDVGLIVPETRDAFKGLVEAAKAAGDQTTYANLIKLSGQFAEVVPAAIEETSNATDAFTRLLGTASKDIVKAQEDILSGINNAIGNAYNNQEQALRDVIKAREDEIKTIEDYRRTLFGGDNSPLSSIEKYQSAKDALSGANAGNVQDLVSKFLESAKIASGSSSDYNASLSFANGILGKVQGGLTNDNASSQSQLTALPETFRNFLDAARAAQNGTLDTYISQKYGGTSTVDVPTIEPLIKERVRSSPQAQDNSQQALIAEIKVLQDLTKKVVETNKLMADKADSNQPQLVEVVK